MNAPHRPLCLLELVATGEGGRCPGDACPFWGNRECVLARVEPELRDRPDVAALLLELRRRLESSEAVPAEESLRRFHARLAAGRE
jgi:hypothetical protein